MENNIDALPHKINYGRVQVTLPMNVKRTILSWASKSGMRKAEFMRVAFMIGAQQLATSVNAKSPGEDYSRQKGSLSACGDWGPLTGREGANSPQA